MIEVLEVLGGLALFLFGVRLLSGGMEKLAGNRLQDLLERLNSKRIRLQPRNLLAPEDTGAWHF